MYMWLYKEDLASGVMVRLDEVEKYIKDGWLDTPDKWGKEGVDPVDGWEAPEDIILLDTSSGAVTVTFPADDLEYKDDGSLEDMTKSELVMYTRASFGVDIDKRKSKINMIKEIEALENG